MDGLIGVFILVGLVLMAQKWFWKIAFFLGALSSLFAMLASIVHFQILGAVGFFFLFVIATLVFLRLAED